MPDDKNLLDLLGQGAPRERMRAALDAEIDANLRSGRGRTMRLLRLAAAFVVALGVVVLSSTLRTAPAKPLLSAEEATDPFRRLELAAELLGHDQHAPDDVARLLLWAEHDASVNVRLLSVDVLASTRAGRVALTSLDLDGAPPIVTQHLRASLERWRHGP